MQRRVALALAGFQGAYYMGTGLWSLVSLDTFQAVTGPKTDLWLVQTVGALVIAISIPLLLSAQRRRIPTEIALLGLGTCLAFAAVEINFAFRGTISSIYLADAALETLLAFGWGSVLARRDEPMSPRALPGARGGARVHDRGVP